MATGLTRPAAGWLIGAAATGFVAGILVMAVPHRASAPIADRELVPAASPAVRQPEPAPAVTAAPPVVGADPLADLRRRDLTVPVEGVQRGDLHDTFSELRDGTRQHEALDILAPRNTPVLAVEGGRIAKLFLSKPGGLTVYQFDPASKYAYYYAHLERYADGLKEGDRVQRGQVIGYVGTSGNAPPNTPHLHFAILKLTDQKRWWQGTAIDPYPVLR